MSDICQKYRIRVSVGGDGATCSDETVAGYLEHYGNTFVPRSDNGLHNPNQKTWYFLTDEL